MLLNLFIKSAKEESIKFAFLRVLKVLSINIHFFIVTLPCTLLRLTTDKIEKDINGYKMKLYLKDKGIARELYAFGKREGFATDIILKNNIIEKDQVVLDIGANIGYYALMESRIVGPKGIVYAVEASPFNHAILEENVGINKFKNITTYNLALGDQTGKAKMFISPRSNWSKIVENASSPDSIQDTIEVDMLTTDEFLKDKKTPSFIRMDVEGYEVNILRGMEKTLRNSPLCLFIEFHSHLINRDDRIEFFNILERNGFEIRYFFTTVPTFNR